jgi:hypothetical protein
MRSFLPLLLISVWGPAVVAQSTSPPSHIQDVAPALAAFTNATVHIDARTSIVNGTLVVRDGRVVAVGDKVTIPAGAAVRDLKGMHLWPALVEPYSELGLPVDKREDRNNESARWGTVRCSPIGWTASPAAHRQPFC